ncbi:hypothetical protein FKP32DRAFT_1575876, partial [Trametes sanguinea]
RNIRALYFSTPRKHPLSVRVATTMPIVETAIAKRFPSFESILGTRGPVRESLVTVSDSRGKSHDFLVAYQERPDLPPNRALQHILPETLFCGELVVMQGGKRVLVVDLSKGPMVKLAKDAVRCFLLETAARRAYNGQLARIPSIPSVLG